MHIFSPHQEKQVAVINTIDHQAKTNTLDFSTVSPVDDYEHDHRMSLTSVHIPSNTLKEKVQKDLIEPFRNISSQHYYYSKDSLHMTVKSIRMISDPPTYTNDTIEKAREVFSKVLPTHRKFNVYFYRFLLFPNNLALIGTTDEELDAIILELDAKLKEAGINDDKKYTNDKYFFCNMTLVRFSEPVSSRFRKKVETLSTSLSFKPYVLDSVTLLTCNAVFRKRTIIDTWKLQ